MQLFYRSVHFVKYFFVSFSVFLKNPHVYKIECKLSLLLVKVTLHVVFSSLMDGKMKDYLLLPPPLLPKITATPVGLRAGIAPLPEVLRFEEMFEECRAACSVFPPVS